MSREPSLPDSTDLHIAAVIVRRPGAHRQSACFRDDFPEMTIFGEQGRVQSALSSLGCPSLPSIHQNTDASATRELSVDRAESHAAGSGQSHIFTHYLPSTKKFTLHRLLTVKYGSPCPRAPHLVRIVVVGRERRSLQPSALFRRFCMGSSHEPDPAVLPVTQLTTPWTTVTDDLFVATLFGGCIQRVCIHQPLSSTVSIVSHRSDSSTTLFVRSNSQ